MSSDPLQHFIDVKKKLTFILKDLIGTFKDLDEVFDLNKFLDKPIITNQTNILDYRSHVEHLLDIILRDHMKVVFFGRTSNGKSTVINSMLREKVLPSGIGHTTNCFVSVQGTSSDEPYILTPNSSVKNNVQNLGQLSNALCDDRLDHSSHIQLYWPIIKCPLLSHDVVLVDSPGIDITPDLDVWIDKFCLDADVFILVSNSESVLTNSEKKFFFKVNSKVSMPNIFILNNRWEAAYNEPETMAQVKQQHLDISINFLVEDLKCTTKNAAMDRVFFVSAREILNDRTNNKSSYVVEGYSERAKDFETFECKMKECLSGSAIKTKFEGHSLTARSLISKLSDILDGALNSISNEKLNILTEIEHLSSQLDLIDSEERKIVKNVDHHIELNTKQLKYKISVSMKEELEQISSLLNEFDYPFFPNERYLDVYKKQLLEYLKTKFDSKIYSKCSSVIINYVDDIKHFLTENISTVFEDQTFNESFMKESNQPSFDWYWNLDISYMCQYYQPDISFRFSLSPNAVLRWILSTYNPNLVYLLFDGANKQNIEVDRNITSFRQSELSDRPSNDTFIESTPTKEARDLSKEYSTSYISPVVLQAVGLLTTTTSGMMLIVFGMAWRIIGRNFVLFGAGSYSMVYAFERLLWTNKAMEKSYKHQFSVYYAEQLNRMIGTASYNVCQRIEKEIRFSVDKVLNFLGDSRQTMHKKLQSSQTQLHKFDEMLKMISKLKFKLTTIDDKLHELSLQYGLRTPSNTVKL